MTKSHMDRKLTSDNVSPPINQHTPSARSNYELNGNVLNPQGVLHLQRLVGNRAVQRILGIAPQSSNRSQSLIQRDAIPVDKATWATPQFYAKAQRLNTKFSRNPPLAGWPYRPDFIRVWETGDLNRFADEVATYQTRYMQMYPGQTEISKADGILGTDTLAALKKSHYPIFATQSAQPEASDPATEAEQTTEATATMPEGMGWLLEDLSQPDLVDLSNPTNNWNMMDDVKAGPEAAMERDFTVQTSTNEHYLYINTAGILKDMPWDSVTRPLIKFDIYPTLTKAVGHSKGSRQRHKKDSQKNLNDYYLDWVEADPAQKEAKQAIFEEKMQEFDTTKGKEIRDKLSEYWLNRSVNVKPSKALFAKLESQIQGILDAFPANTASSADEIQLPNSVSMTDDPQKLRKTLLALEKQFASLPVSIDSEWVKALGDSVTQYRSDIKQMGDEITFIRKKIVLKGAKKGSLTGNDVRLVYDKLLALRTKLEKWTDFLSTNQEKIDQYNQQTFAGQKAQEVQTLPLLIPNITRTYQTLTYGGWQATFHDHHEASISWFRPSFSSGTLKPKTPEARTEQFEQKYKSDGPQKAFEVYTGLLKQGFSESEAKVAATVASGEGSFHTSQSVDWVRFSWGISQFQGGTLMEILNALNSERPEVFQQYFGQYGIQIGLRQHRDLNVDTQRKNRQIARDPRASKKTETSGVKDLIVYDHTAHQWVSGNEGLWIIQTDPRYQMLFRVFGMKDAGQAFQAHFARKSYLAKARNYSITIAGKSFKVSDVINNEVAMFALHDRTVQSGSGRGPKPVKGLIQSYLAAKLKVAKETDETKTLKNMVEDLLAGQADATVQAELAEWFRNHGNEKSHWDGAIRWNLVGNIEQLDLTLSSTSWDGE